MDPRRASYKYVILCLIVLFIPGPYFHDGLLATFKGPISDSLQLSNSEFASLFAVSSFSGVFCGPAGAIIPIIGRTRVAVASSFAAAMGSTLVTLGFKFGSLSLMLLGRFIFWLALNCLLLVQTILTYDLFSGKELDGAMTFIVCSIRLGGSLAYFLSGPLLTGLGVLTSLWLSVAFVFGAFVATVLFAYLFRWSEIARTMNHPVGRRNERSTFSLEVVKQVPTSVFFFLGAIAATWGVVFPFEVVGDDMLQTDFGYDANYAGVIIAIAPSISICSPLIAPFLGTLLHQKLLACFTGLATLTLAFAVISYGYPITGILMVGIGYAISVCACYSTLPMFIKAQVPGDIAKSVETLVVGINMATSGVAMIVSNIVIGVIKDHSSYKGACVYLAFMGVCGLFSLVAAVALREPFVALEQDAGGGELHSVGSSERELQSVDPTVMLTLPTAGVAIADEYCDHGFGHGFAAQSCDALAVSHGPSADPSDVLSSGVVSFWSQASEIINADAGRELSPR